MMDLSQSVHTLPKQSEKVVLSFDEYGQFDEQRKYVNTCSWMGREPIKPVPVYDKVNAVFDAHSGYLYGTIDVEAETVTLEDRS